VDTVERRRAAVRLQRFVRNICLSTPTTPPNSRSSSFLLIEEEVELDRSRLDLSSNPRASPLNSAGQCSSHGSGSSSAISIARHAANGRRAHHRCNVEGCPCRMDFSLAECFDTTAMGKSTSARRLHSFGIMRRFQSNGGRSNFSPQRDLAAS
jgi:hypothetical protein